MDSTIGRIEVNAAIERLINREPSVVEDAGIVILYGSKLKCGGNFHFERRSSNQSSRGTFSGHSPGHGEVTIEDRESREEKHWSFGVYKERVGYFKLWKSSEGLLHFQYFWKSEVTTQSISHEVPDEYYLGYHPDTLEPQYLGIFRKRLFLKFWNLEFFKPYLEPLYGKVPKLGGIHIEQTVID